MSPECDFPSPHSLSVITSIDEVIKIVLIYCSFRIQVVSASSWKYSASWIKLAYKGKSKPFVRVQKIGGTELRKKSRICSNRRGLRSTKGIPFTQQVLPAHWFDSIAFKNGDCSSVDLSVVNWRPPTLIMNGSVIDVAVLE